MYNTYYTAFHGAYLHHEFCYYIANHENHKEVIWAWNIFCNVPTIMLN